MKSFSRVPLCLKMKGCDAQTMSNVPPKFGEDRINTKKNPIYLGGLEKLLETSQSKNPLFLITNQNINLK